MKRQAILIGNSDGIGLALTRKFLKKGWEVVGISRSKSSMEDPSYEHIVAEVQKDEYDEKLNSLMKDIKNI